jgi:RNA polymerase sigma-70 factor (ECF subfamily)
MSDLPPTRATLLVRLRDVRDERAWEEFVEIYAPLVYRYARRRGLQDADAADVTQDVLRAAARTMPAFEYDPTRGRFRSWLFTVARNEITDLLSRGGRGRGAGDTAVHELLANHPDRAGDEQTWEREYEQRLFQWAAERVRAGFQESTWQAFWKTAVEGESPQSVAEELGLSTGAVYVAKSRVVAQLKAEVVRQLGEEF